MCGIAGLLSRTSRQAVALREAAVTMADTLIHRGPDQGGVWATDGVALSHRRLSILDLEGGRQPMVGASGCVLTFNGEIYNFGEMKSELEGMGVVLREHGDTEVLLRAYETWGADCLRRLNGMFAFAVWDPSKRSLFLARDRMGEKPLYYCHTTDGFAFASEIKALLTLPEAASDAEIDLESLSDYLSLGYILTPKSIFKNIRRLPAATYAWYELETGRLSLEEYWRLRDFYLLDKLEYNASTQGHFAELFDDAVRLRMRSDVPLGVFLSGGLDSSSIAASMARQTQTPVHAFCVGFEDSSFDESRHAEGIAKSLGLDLEISLHRAQDADELERLSWLTDEPFADTSLLSCDRLNAMARRNMTVALSGDGADEILGGYPTYRANEFYRLYALAPPPLQSGLDWLARRILKPSYRKVGLDYKIRHFLASRGLSPEKAHYWWRLHFTDGEKARLLSQEVLRALNGYDPFTTFQARFDEVRHASFLDQTLYVDAKTWLQDDILIKVDRSSMAHSLEVRAPFLDHRLVELCARLPKQAKLNTRRQKLMLRDTLGCRLPPSTLKRAKQGFNVPTIMYSFHRLRGCEKLHLFRSGFCLDPKAEDITYKSFAIGMLGHWLDRYDRFRTTQQWSAC